MQGFILYAPAIKLFKKNYQTTKKGFDPVFLNAKLPFALINKFVKFRVKKNEKEAWKKAATRKSK